MTKTKSAIVGLGLSVVLGATLTGCIGYVERPRHTRSYAPPPPPPPPVYVEREVVVQDHYVYYPGYQVYYSSSRRQYVYLDGRSWVSRPAPPRVSVDVLFASPSVRLDFNDAPSVHHATVVRQYPKHWKPTGASPNHGDGNRGNGNGKGKGNDKGNRQ
jgi:hypothetical protein